MNKVQPSILSNLTLKNKIIEDIVRDCDFTEDFVEKHYQTFLKYADIKIELIQQHSETPFENFKIYNELQFEQSKYFLYLNYLFEEEVTNKK